jgi:hypothetical protein
MTHDPIQWRVKTIVTHRHGDIDSYRFRFGREEGERVFLGFPATIVGQSENNLLTLAGASCLWEALIGNGTATAAQALTYFNAANAALGVGDSTTAENAAQTDLQAAANKVRQGMDAGYPKHTDGTTGKAITGATNASPIVITSAGHGFATGDFVAITGVTGNTAANGLWQITLSDANSFSLNGSTGNAAYVSGGLASKPNVVVFQASFGGSVANWTWNEWAIFNSASAGVGRMLNRKVAALGAKTTGTFTLSVALNLS